MKAGWRDAPLALRDLAVSNMHLFKPSVLLVSMSSETSILSYSNIYILPTRNEEQHFREKRA